ncbi:cupin domain-containing protein [Cuniculiplasma divulgatum]|uniref:Cupin n=1 Tax=Cuniculiplasma divulgatum TaxID=1673428 RepID=A0A1N5W0Z8_9ARCH|nr:cupin domain-containing protein [Cuniculiplasma divulgatum]SIM78400.1 cupin [Cuniculiplasma divulgatum]
MKTMKAVLTKKETGTEQIRLDLAWELFFPGITGKHPHYSDLLYPFTNWLWTVLGNQSGFMRQEQNVTKTFKINDMEESSLVFLIRILSMWFDEVIIDSDDESNKNQWTFPITNVYDEDLDEAEKAQQLIAENYSFRNLMPLLGPSRVFATVELLGPDQVSARLHSHSTIDEFYLILDGSATLRMNGKERVVKRGDFISKPAGPDLTSQILADQGTSVRILDIEVHPNADPRTKEVVHYPDHGEILLHGHGWSSIIPDGALMNTNEFDKNYEKGYYRKKDGSWEPKDIPGYERRKD